MQISNFESDLIAWQDEYGDDAIPARDLDQFPFDVGILENKGTGLVPFRLNGEDFYNARELIGYARMHSIPNEGYVSRKYIRAAEILKTDTVYDYKTGFEFIKVVYVACAYNRDPECEKFCHVSFICPFCGCMHSHGCDGKEFGDGDGYRVPHCHCDTPAYYRLNSQKYGLYLASSWQFYLVEQEDHVMAGDFPRSIAKHIVSRHKV